MENFAKLNRNDIGNKISQKNEKNYINQSENYKILLDKKNKPIKQNSVNNEYISEEDTQNEINLIKGTEISIKVGSNSEKGKNLINLENPNENIFIKAKPFGEEYKNDKELQNDISKKSMESNTINNKNESETENLRKENKIPFIIKDDEIKAKNSEIKKKDIIINELNKHEKKDKEIETLNLKIKEITHNNNHRQSEGKEPLDFFEKPTLIGLQKIGEDSYMNATLQCFSQIEELTNYFLDENISGDKIRNNNVANKNENLPQLSPIYLELLKKLWDKNNIKGTYSPYKFKETIEIMNPLFKFCKSDPKDFVLFLLEQFHIELKKDLSNNNNENNKYKVNTQDQQNTFMFFLKDFIKKTSVISDIFYGIEESTLTCLFCKEKFSKKGKPYPILYNYTTFNFFIFPLDGIKKLKVENNLRSNTNMIENNEVTLDDCFYFHENPELLTGDNRMFCGICNQVCDSFVTSKIYSCPKVLIIILNRGKNNMYKIKLNFEEIIDITKFVSVKEENVIYQLTCVITYYVEGESNGQFLAFCRSPIDNHWYKYNDANVSEVKDVKKDIIDFADPYILFYKKI